MAEYLVHLEILNSMRSQLCCISWGCLDLLRTGEFEPEQGYMHCNILGRERVGGLGDKSLSPHGPSAIVSNLSSRQYCSH